MSDKPKNPVKMVDCVRCGISTNHDIVCKFEDDIEDGVPVEYDHYLIVKCRGCCFLSFVREYLLEDNLIVNQDGTSESHPTVLVYPKRNTVFSGIEGSHNLPPNVKIIYKETIEALNNDLFVLAAMGIRTIVETVCEDNKASGKDLNQKIDGLVSIGLVTSKGSEILHNLRFMGNEAAHNVKTHDSKELSAALKVIDHLLIEVYIIPKLARDLPQKRTNQKLTV